MNQELVRLLKVELDTSALVTKDTGFEAKSANNLLNLIEACGYELKAENHGIAGTWIYLVKKGARKDSLKPL